MRTTRSSRWPAALVVALALASCGPSERSIEIEVDTDSGSGAPPEDVSSAASGRKAHPNEIRGEVTIAYKPAPAGATPVRGDIAVLPLLSDIDSFNPYTSSSAEAQEVQDLLFPRLALEQADYYKGPPTFEPRVAESWTFGDDQLSIRFKLRECAWSDGTPITADDVRFSWQAARHPKVAWVSASIVDFIADVEIHSPRELTVRYREKSPYQLMDINDVQIVPRHIFEKVPFDDWQKHGLWSDQAKVSGGPFVLEKYTPNQEIVLGRNSRFWMEGKPYLDRIVFRVVGDMRTQVSTLLAGDVDAMRQVVPKDARRVLDSGLVDLYSYTSRSYIYVGWNCEDPLFADHRVRQAMTYAINRENITESVYYGYAKVAGPHIISSFWASNSALSPLPYDPAKARELLREAGWQPGAGGTLEKDGKPFQFELQTNSGNPMRQQICEQIQANLRDVGVRAEIRLMDFNQWAAQLKKHNFQAYVGGWYVATKVDLKPTYHSTSVNGSYNYVNFKDARADEIIDTARTMLDLAAAKPLWDELQVILHREQPYTMLFEPRGIDAIHKRFRNVRVTSLRTYENIDSWWVPKGEQKY